MRTNDEAGDGDVTSYLILRAVTTSDHAPCCRCGLGQGLGAPGAAGGGGGQAARAQVRAVNQEKALVRTFFVIVKSLPMFR